MNEIRQRILVVDDEKPIRFAMTAYFESRRYSVDGAPDADEARALADRHRYPVAIVDLCLKGRNDESGLDLAEHLLEIRPGTRIVILTACGSSSAEERARKLGVDNYSQTQAPGRGGAQIVFALMEQKARE